MRMLHILLIALFLDWLGKVFPEAVYWVFAYPAAFLASVFLGSHPVVHNSREVLIPLVDHAIHVVPSCSGYGFFCLLTALIVSSLWYRRDNPALVLYSILAVPAAYAVTVVVNGFRIISAYQAHELSRVFLPANFQAAVHQGVGVVVFLTALMGVSLWLGKEKVS